MPTDLSISFVIPTRNRASLLERAIHSALSDGVEVVVIDDDSKDNTRTVVNQLRHSPVSYICLGSSVGPCAARNLGVRRAEGDLIVLLDDDDTMLPGSHEIIRLVATQYPDYQLYLHNCVYSNGQYSLQPSDLVRPCDFRSWLDGEYNTELKPVIRRELFSKYCYSDTRAGGEGILWGRVIRDQGAIVSYKPIMSYNTEGLERLTSAISLIHNAEYNAKIAQEFLREFGDDLRNLNSRRWAERVTAAATYHLLSGQRAQARETIDAIPRCDISRATRVALTAASLLPLWLVRALFIAYRREMVTTLRGGYLPRVLRSK